MIQIPVYGRPEALRSIGREPEDAGSVRAVGLSPGVREDRSVPSGLVWHDAADEVLHWGTLTLARSGGCAATGSGGSGPSTPAPSPLETPAYRAPRRRAT